MNKIIKFRQRNGGTWHYWGFIDDDFTSPVSTDTKGYPSYQYTGLKDKNGKEIYEGDVLKMSDYGAVGKIEFDQRQQRYIWKHKDYPLSSWSHKYWKWVSNSEVIGNIYENPELLKT